MAAARQQEKQTHPSDTASDSVTQGTHQVWSFSSLALAMTLNQQNGHKTQVLLVSKMLMHDADVERELKYRHGPKGKIPITVFGNMPFPLGILPHSIYCKHFIWVTFQPLQGVFVRLVCIPCNHSRRTPWICSIRMSRGSEPQFAVAQGAPWSAHPIRRGDGAEPPEH